MPASRSQSGINDRESPVARQDPHQFPPGNGPTPDRLDRPLPCWIFVATVLALAGVTRADDAGLTRPNAEREAGRLWQDRMGQIRRDSARADEVKARRIDLDDLKMPFFFKVNGTKPSGGRSLFLSMHGGGGAPARVNDQQYQNQQKLYKPAEGVYLAPRAPTDTWDLWHQSHIDRFFARLILDMVVFEDVDPDKVYLMGYSAGGDGVYQVAPRMADRFAAAAMMAGHPNESKPFGLRNLPFNLHMGGNDTAYNRNTIARTYGDELDTLARNDPGGYPHLVEIHAGKGHWMDREDASAVPWMAQYRRDAAPKKVVWYQDDVTHDQFYWLAVPPGQAKAGATVVASVVGQEVKVERAEGVKSLLIRLDDRLVDLDQPVQVTVLGQTRFTGKLPRTVATLQTTLDERNDPQLMFAAEVEVPVVAPPR